MRSLIDVNDVALGCTTKQQMGPLRGHHPPAGDQRRDLPPSPGLMADQTRGRTSRGRIRARHPYALSGRLLSGVCDCKMQSHWTNELAN
jgi:hypothetical protein